jgi:hypothetical protein
MKQAVRRALSAIAPRWTAALIAIRGRRHAHRVVQSWGCADLNRRLVERLGLTVCEGPFAGTVLPRAALAEHLGPFLLGVYESELDPAWDVVLARRYPQILDIGSSFGYYAAGLARRVPEARVTAFDIDPWARAAVRDAARVNGLANLTAAGFCDPAWLAASLQGNALIVSDCEGYESELFTSRPIPHLATAHLIIETHDHRVAGTTERLTALFAPTHDVRTFTTGMGRRTVQRADLGFLTDQERAFVQQEVRMEQAWLFCRPLAPA